MSTAPAMIFRGLDSNGDWNFGNGLGSYAMGEAAVLLNVKTAIMLFLGDAFWDASKGIDWLNLLGTKGTQNAILAAVRSTIVGCDGVTGITSLSSSVNDVTRTMSISATISTIYSQSAAVSAQITI